MRATRRRDAAVIARATSRVTIALRMAARSVGKTMTPLGLFYRRIRSRIGGLGAVKATAHKLACLVYRMLKYGEEYVTQSMEEYEAKMKANMLKALKRKAAAMGFQLSPLPTPIERVDRGRRHRATGLLAMHNAERPNPPASVRDTGGRGGLLMSSIARSKNRLSSPDRHRGRSAGVHGEGSVERKGPPTLQR